MRTVALIPDGVGVRNLVLGPFLGKASEAGESLVLHAIPETHLDDYRAVSPEAHWHALVADPEGVGRRTVRNTLLVTQMRWADTLSMRLKLRWVTNTEPRPSVMPSRFPSEQ